VCLEERFLHLRLMDPKAFFAPSMKYFSFSSAILKSAVRRHSRDVRGKPEKEGDADDVFDEEAVLKLVVSPPLSYDDDGRILKTRYHIRSFPIRLHSVLRSEEGGSKSNLVFSPFSPSLSSFQRLRTPVDWMSSKEEGDDLFRQTPGGSLSILHRSQDNHPSIDEWHIKVPLYYGGQRIF